MGGARSGKLPDRRLRPSEFKGDELMKRMSSVMVVLATVATAQAKLQIQDIKAAHGLLGPERKSLLIQPYDEVLFRYTLTGVQVDGEGKADLTEAVALVDASGKTLLEQKLPQNDLLPLGGGKTFGFVRLTLDEVVPPGDYTLKVTVTDNLAKETVSFERKLTSKEPTLSIVAPSFFADPEGKIPASTSGLVGQKLFFHFKCIGFDRSQGKIDVDMHVQILDDKGTDTMPKPIQVSLKTEDPDQLKKAKFLTFNGDLTLHRAGKFTLRLTVLDKVSKKSVQFDAPLVIQEP
jgi:hypothetical protein